MHLLSVGYLMRVFCGVEERKSQAKATTFLVLFMLLVPTVLALSYTNHEASLTGAAVGNTDPTTTAATVSTITTDTSGIDDINSHPQTTETITSGGGDGIDFPDPTDSTDPPPPDTPQPEDQPEQTDPPQEEPQTPEEEQPDQLGEQGSPQEPPTDEPQPPQPEEEQPEQNQTDPDTQTNPCEGVICIDSFLTCIDGFNSTCPNTCNPETGLCGICTPDCTGHDIPTEPANETGTNDTVTEEPIINETEINGTEINETQPAANVTEPLANETNITEPIQPEPPEPCNTTCGECDILDEENCTCYANESCQPSQPIPECITDPDCDDSVSCTADACFNGTCQYQSIIPCCGNGDCELVESFETCPSDCDQPLPLEPAFNIIVDAPERVTRGTTAEFSATIENTGAGTALNVRPYWILPEGLQLIASTNDCDTGVLLPGTFCTATAQIYVEPMSIGRKEIRILVDYE